jgi:hypothetical protein
MIIKLSIDSGAGAAWNAGVTWGRENPEALKAVTGG